MPANIRMPVGRRCNIDDLRLGHCRYYSVGTMNFECKYCKALGWKDENRGTRTNVHFGILCCNQGKIELDPIPELPQRMLDLYTERSVQAKYFQNNLRFFNAGMALASMTFKNKNGDATVRAGQGSGPGVFKVCGQLQRRVGSMLQNESADHPQCMQTYFHDEEFQAQHRANRNSSTSQSETILNRRVAIFRLLRNILINDCNNSYLRSYITVNDYIKENNLNPSNLHIELHATEKPLEGHHPGRYHVPNCPEIALLKDPNPPVGAHRTVVCSVRQGTATNRNLHFMQDYHRSYIPLLYVLLFPHGTDGWTLGKTFETDGVRNGCKVKVQKTYSFDVGTVLHYE